MRDVTSIKEWERRCDQSQVGAVKRRATVRARRRAPWLLVAVAMSLGVWVLIAVAVGVVHL